MADTEIIFEEVCTDQEIERYLLDSESGYIEASGGREFNLLDVVLITGKNGLTP